MASRSLRFVIDTENGRLLPGFRSIISSITPKFTVGDQVPVEVYLCRGAGASLQEVPFPAGGILRLGIGQVNESPTAGTWTLTFGGDTTAALPYNATTSQVQTALNALASITSAGGVTVEKVGDAYSIAFNTAGDRGPVTGSPGSLVPLSSIAIQTLQEGTVSLPEVILAQVKVRPIAFTETFTDIPAPVISRTGQTWAIAGQVKSGSYTLSVTFDGDTQETGQIAFNASTASVESSIAAALKLLDWPAGTDPRPVKVTQVDSQTWAVSFWDGGSYLSGVNGANLVGFAGKAGTLSLATTEALAFIGSDSQARAVLEAEVEVGGERQTLVQAGADIFGDLILAGAFEPASLEEALSEAVANERFVRRDADQTLDATTKDQIWENLLGATSPSGVNLVGAITGAASPSGANPLATLADIPPAFDQDLNTTDAVSFTGITSTANLRVDGDASVSSFKVADLSSDYLTISATGSLSSVESASFGGTGVALTNGTALFSIQGSGLDTALGYDNLSFAGTQVLDADSLYLTDGVNSVQLDVSGGLVFASANGVTDIAYSAATGQSGGSGSTIHNSNYPDEIQVVINGVTYAMPARTV